MFLANFQNFARFFVLHVVVISEAPKNSLYLRGRPGGVEKKRGEDNLTNGTPAKDVFHLFLVSLLHFSCKKREDRPDSEFFWRAALFVRFPPPHMFCAPPPVMARRDLLMGGFRGAVFRPKNSPLSSRPLMGRFPSLMGRFPTLMGRFPDFVLMGRFTSSKSTEKQLNKKGALRCLNGPNIAVTQVLSPPILLRGSHKRAPNNPKAGGRSGSIQPCPGSRLLADGIFPSLDRQSPRALALVSEKYLRRHPPKRAPSNFT